MADDRKKGHKRIGKHPERALSAAYIRGAKAGKYADGNGLYLIVDESGAKRWVLRTTVHGRRRDIGLGGLRLVSLAEAREEATRLRKMARTGGDPLAQRRIENRVIPVFKDAAKEVFESRAKHFKNEKHKEQWWTTIETYINPFFGDRRVDHVETSDVLRALLAIWIEKPETARRTKQRVQTVFEYAKAKGWRSGDNPVEGVSLVLPKHSRKQEHHAALPYAEVPAFLQKLYEHEALPGRLAFEFLILTATRTSEVLLATWNEISFEKATWTIPDSRMKAGAEHLVPLSARSLEILHAAEELADGGPYIFPGEREKQPLSNMVFLMMLRRMGRADLTAHGFRSSFRDWAEERTSFPHSVVEAALAHTVRDKVEAAYLPTRLFDKRRELMDAWSHFATTPAGAKVVSMRAGR